jgi:NAD(P)H-dependent flavin oxidoreductase YrpB (nitropropane dioxygenase family)
MPILAAPMDSVVSPETAIEIGKLGGVGVLDLEGLWTRYDKPEKLLEEISKLKDSEATARMQQIYAEPIKPELIRDRIAQIRAGGVTVSAALSPQRTAQFSDVVIKAGVDLFVIRGNTVSAEHVAKDSEPLNLKKFIYELDVPVIVGGVANYTAALHLMRTGAAGVRVGFGGGADNKWEIRPEYKGIIGAYESMYADKGGMLAVKNTPKTDDGKINYKEDFFGKETNLTVSGQLEAETYAMALGQVYTFGPTFRAENSNTSRHLVNKRTQTERHTLL